MTAFSTFLALQLARLTQKHTMARGRRKPDLDDLDTWRSRRGR